MWSDWVKLNVMSRVSMVHVAVPDKRVRNIFARRIIQVMQAFIPE